MKKSIRTSLIVIALLLLLLAGLVWLMTRPDQTDELLAETISDTSGGPSFEVRVVMPRSSLPFGGILPDALVKKMDGTPRELRFDHTSTGAEIGNVEHNHVELRADNWTIVVETDDEGRITPLTHVAFPIDLGGRQLKLDCRPAEPATGSLSTITREGSDKLFGRFVVEVVTCKNAESGKTTNWPPAPLTVSGRFNGLPLIPSQKPKPVGSVVP